MRFALASAILLTSLVLTACASGHTEATTNAPATNSAGLPLIEQPVAAPTAGAPGQVNTACATDADCAVKDVGNCCGYYPACVNKDSPTFPEQVKAECAKNDMMSTCGFREISSCACVDGQCAASGEGEGPVR